MPQWLQRGLAHAALQGFGDQDAVLLNKQQNRLQQAPMEPSSEQRTRRGYFLPSIADIEASTFNRWYDRYSHDGK